MRWHQAYRLIAALAVPLVVSVHSEVSLLFAAGTIPGWHSTIFPPYFVLGAAFSGFAVVSMIAIALRSLFNLQNLVTDEHLDLLGKVLLATGSDDGLRLRLRGIRRALFRRRARNPDAAATASSAHTGGAIGARSSSISWCLQPLWWRSRAPHAAGCCLLISTSVAVGMWLERYMILVTSLYRDFLVSSWGAYHADVLGLGDLCRHHRAFPGAVPADHPLVPGDLDLRNQGSSARRTGGVEHAPRHDCLWRCWPNSTPRRRCSQRPSEARKAGYRDLDAFTPFPVYELFPVLRLHDRRVLWLGLIGGIFGCALALGMQFFTNFDYPINVGGRPLYALSAFAVVASS